MRKDQRPPEDTKGSGSPDAWYQSLSPKECEVLETYAQVHSYEAVAMKLGKSESVVDRQLQSARRKMGVTSTAEAMYLLAERKSRIARHNMGEPIATSDASDDVGTSDVRRSRAYSSSSRILAWTIPGLLAIVGTVYFLGSITLGAPLDRHANSESRSQTLLDLKNEIAEFDRGTNPSRLEQKLQAQRVGALCERAWHAMWGPDEDAIRNAVSEVSTKIRRCLEWAFKEEPDLAIAIVGNGYPAFKNMAGFSDVVQLLDRAVRLQGVKSSPSLGRALCGVAAELWKDDHKRGVEAAKQAVAIFRAHPGHAWDEANALRLMGVCSMGKDKQRKALYTQALAIFRKVGDLRGQAQTTLSFGQAGIPESWPCDNGAKLIDWNLQAAELFFRLNNPPKFMESMREVAMGEKNIPRAQAYDPLRRRLRASFLALASYHRSRNDQKQEIRALTHCLRADHDLNDRKAFLDDLEKLLADLSGVGYLLPKGGVFGAYYLALCEQSSRAPNRQASLTMVVRRSDREAAAKLSTGALVALLAEVVGE